MKGRLLAVLTFVVLGLCVFSCSDEQGPIPQNGAADTPIDRTRSDLGTDAQTVDSTQDGVEGDQNPTTDTVVDTDVPSDGDLDDDGLSDDCELSVEGLDPTSADSDNDGLDDGEEDANLNCEVDEGETDPTNQDTDADGITDGGEALYECDPLDPDTDDDGIYDGHEIAFSHTDPTDPDSDDDGCLDGVEDPDGDGRVGSCGPDEYDSSCAEGETDPNNPDTDGDGVGDCDEVEYVVCAPDVVREPDLLRLEAYDVTLAVEPLAPNGPIDLSTPDTAVTIGTYVDDEPLNISAFLIALDPPDGETVPSALAEGLVAASEAILTDASRRTSGRSVLTHDGYDALVEIVIEFPTEQTPSELRLELIAQLANSDVGDLTLDSSVVTTGHEDGLVAVFEVLVRDAELYLVVGAVTTQIQYDDISQMTGIRVDDLTGGTAVAGFGALLEPACVSYVVTSRPAVDFIWSIDGSGSMGDERDAVALFADDFVTILDRLDIDYRFGVLGGQCEFLGGDSSVSPEARGLVAGADFDCAGSFPFVPPTPGGSNGRLCENRFLTDPAEIHDCILQATEWGGEFTLSMGSVAIDRALPRTRDAEAKVRPNSEIVLVVVTDEHEQSFEDILDWMTDVVDGPDTPAQQAQLDAIVERYTTFLGRPEIAATVFGIYWVPGEVCDTGAEVAFGIHQVVLETGGTAGSLCLDDITTTLEAIGEAASGLASSFRLLGRPVSLTIKVATAAPAEPGVEVDRSRENGFDYDGAVNRILFTGDSTPSDGDEVTISYQRWIGGTIGCESDDDCPLKFFCRDGECI